MITKWTSTHNRDRNVLNWTYEEVAAYLRANNGWLDLNNEPEGDVWTLLVCAAPAKDPPEGGYVMGMCGEEAALDRIANVIFDIM